MGVGGSAGNRAHRGGDASRGQPERRHGGNAFDKKVSSLRTQGPIGTAPVPQEVLQMSDRIACIHMSGLLMRSVWTAGQDGFRDASSKQPRGLSLANGSHGVSRTSDRSILPSGLLLQLRLGRGRRTRRAADLLSGGRRYARHPRAIVLSPVAISLQAMRAFLLASATAASFGGLRLSRSSSQRDGRPRALRACWTTAVAPATSRLRNISSPARVILPSLVLPPLE